MVHQFMSSKVMEDAKARYNHFCDSLLKVKESCIDVKLKDCYEGHDFDAHSAYLIETLKISGDVIAIHLGNVTDVPNCPVFHLDGSMSLVPLTDDTSSVNIAMAVILSLIVTVLLVSGLVFIAIKLRLVPRAQACVANTPYTHELTRPGNNVEIVPAANA